MLCHGADTDYRGLGPNADTGEMEVRFSESLFKEKGDTGDSRLKPKKQK